MLRLILSLLFLLPVSLLAQTAPYSLILEGGMGHATLTNRFEAALSFRLVFDHQPEKRTNFFQSAGLFTHYTFTQFNYTTDEIRCSRSDTGQEYCYPENLFAFTPIVEKRLSIGAGLRHTYRKFSVRIAMNPSLRVAVKKALLAATTREFSLIEFTPPDRTRLQEEVNILQRSYLIRKNSNFQLQLSADFHLLLGRHLTLGLGLRTDVLSYTLTLENPGRNIPGGPLILGQADMRSFAIMGATGWRF